MAQTLYRPAHGACIHSHTTIVGALACARSLHSDLELVVLKNGHVERLDGVEERIRSAACTLYDQTEREIFDIHWAKSLSGFTDAERDIIYTRWKQSGTFVPVIAPARRRPSETIPYRNQYKCPYGDKTCGEKARYCWRCNEKYEEFLLLINDDR
jgi:hypothetical protein